MDTGDSVFIGIWLGLAILAPHRMTAICAVLVTAKYLYGMFLPP